MNVKSGTLSTLKKIIFLYFRTNTKKVTEIDPMTFKMYQEKVILFPQRNRFQQVQQVRQQLLLRQRRQR